MHITNSCSDLLTPRTISTTRLAEEMRDFSGAGAPFFNSAHLNLYRTGGDHVSWHTDEDVALYYAHMST